MATFVFGMHLSLDGYVDHLEMRPDPGLFRHWIDVVRGLTGSVYGRRMYEIMRYWDEDYPGWDADEQEFAAAWRRHPKWVVSRTLTSVGPNATLVSQDIEAAMLGLKARLAGEIAVSGSELAHSLTGLGLIDEYRLYFHSVVLGRGTPFFAGPPAAAAPGCRRSHRRGHHQADLCPGLIGTPSLIGPGIPPKTRDFAGKAAIGSTYSLDTSGGFRSSMQGATPVLHPEWL